MIGRRLKGIWRSRDGVSALEFALVAPFVIILCIAVVDLGRGIWQWLEVGNAARAGADYAQSIGLDATDTSIQNAVNGATSLYFDPTASQPQIVLSRFCGCPTASGVLQETCGTTCTMSGSNNEQAGTYESVTTKMTYSPLLPYPGLSNTLPLQATSIARLY